MTEEELTRETQRLVKIKSQAINDLLPIPGIYGVGIGLKETKGQIRKEVGWIIYVKEKKNNEELISSHKIPPVLYGAITDVQLLIQARKTDGDYPNTRHYNVLEGGIAVENTKSGSGKGTLGCFATASTDAHTYYLLSANHVIFNGGAGSNTQLSQPDPGYCGCCCPGNIIAQASEYGLEGQYNYNGVTYYIDCAKARLKAGVRFVNKIAGINGKNRATNASAGNLVSGTIPASSPLIPGVSRIFKTGFMTGPTTGIVSAIDATAHVEGKEEGSVVNQIIIIPDISPYSESGDSGAVMVNEFNEVAGIFHAAGATSAGAPRGVACHIAPVLQALNISIPQGLTTETVVSSGEMLAGIPLEATEEISWNPEIMKQYEDKLNVTEKGRRLADAIKKHWKEVVDLVHYTRPVKVVWHRNYGPAWVAHAANNAKDENYKIPMVVKGVTQQDLVKKMTKALSNYATFALKNEIENYYSFGVNSIAGTGNLRELEEIIHQIPTVE